MKRATVPIALTLLLVAATIPHTAEDFRYGEFARFGVPTSVAAGALIIVYALQLSGIVFAWRGMSVGFWLLAAGGLVWCIGAIAVHGSELFASEPYRNGLESKALIIAIIVLGAAVAVASSMRPRR
ncbi:MAG TPA: hypothetical protein VFO25_04605 [Candidatus Eremiobacteraceae bacterium]|nr:hypothetical protein [Candidatus Eremiobacteraceae bacterium]